MGTSAQPGAGIAQCHNYRGTDIASVLSAAPYAGHMLHLQWPASGLSRQTLHLFFATMTVGHFWSVIAVQMQHLVLGIFFSLLQSTLQSLPNIIEFAYDTCAFACLDPL